MLIKQLIETPYHKPENKVKTSGISERLLRCNDFPILFGADFSVTVH